MTVAYTDDSVITPTMAAGTATPTEDFVPRYARAKRSKKSVRTWMILAPIGAIVLLGGGAAMMMGAGEDRQPLGEGATPTLVEPLAATQVPLESSVLPEPVISDVRPAPVVREAPPAPPPAVRRRVAPVESQAPAASARVETSAPPAAAEPTPGAPAEPPAPTIAVTPLG